MVQDMKTEIEAINKTETKGILEMENLGKWSRTTDASITKRIQETAERISGVLKIQHWSNKMLNPTNF